ncbi:MAG: CDP-alcohol phosphatidyltransferase family protein [bacterium]
MKDIFSLANCFSYIRALTGIVIAFIFLFPTVFPSLIPNYFQLLIIIILIINTDWLDGMAARKGWFGSKETQLGAKLDPLADKVFGIALMIVILLILPAWYIVAFFFFFILLEGIVNLVVQKKLMSFYNGEIIISQFSKNVTVVQAILIALIFLFLAMVEKDLLSFSHDMVVNIVIVFFWLMAGLSLIRVFNYFLKYADLYFKRYPFLPM